jgi:2-polyprenyl-3-methyl-5-hydroxy-6-metoxy-1,4-benzoquinol methylase
VRSLPQVSKDSGHTLIDSTLSYYQTHADEYAQKTNAADLSSIHQKFSANLLPGARILDLGCGGGRDLKAFVELGFCPVGIDASSALASIASQTSGASTKVQRIEDINYIHEFDGVWACASLLHIPHREIRSVLGKIRSALIAGGPLFISIQEGSGEFVDEHGRKYFYHTEDEFTSELKKAKFQRIEAWKTKDTLLKTRDINWLNFIAT